MKNSLEQILNELQPYSAKLVAVSKTQSVGSILNLYDKSQFTFCENYVQEMTEKYAVLPKELEWHFIGHLQRNKVKFISSFVHTIQSVDSWKLLREISRQSKKMNRTIPCFLQMHISGEDNKFGMNDLELMQLLEDWLVHPEEYSNIKIAGMMGMGTNTTDQHLVRTEFKKLRGKFDKIKKDFFLTDHSFKEISMGMSSDYKIALEEGSTMVRIGSLLFGSRK